MACKGICLRLRAMKPFGLGRYSDGQKRCQMCSIFIKWEGLFALVVDTGFVKDQEIKNAS